MPPSAGSSSQSDRGNKPRNIDKMLENLKRYVRNSSGAPAMPNGQAPPCLCAAVLLRRLCCLTSLQLLVAALKTDKTEWTQHLECCQSAGSVWQQPWQVWQQRQHQYQAKKATAILGAAQEDGGRSCLSPALRHLRRKTLLDTYLQ